MKCTYNIIILAIIYVKGPAFSNSQYGKNWGQDGTTNASERGKGANSG
jgi:hypothetical protein